MRWGPHHLEVITEELVLLGLCSQMLWDVCARDRPRPPSVASLGVPSTSETGGRAHVPSHSLAQHGVVCVFMSAPVC